jgi:DNA-directed RNA polymerase specialized sigma24 family protein
MFCFPDTTALKSGLRTCCFHDPGGPVAMSSAGSVTQWLSRLKAGDQAAAQPLWEAYFRRLVERGRRRLAGRPRTAADEEDVALSAFDSFCRGAQRGTFPRLDDRKDLWQLLLVITDRKVIDLVKRECRAKRGGGQVLGEGDLPPTAPGTADNPLAQIPGPEPTPAFAAQLAEEFERLLGRLGDAELRSVALWKMEGHTVEEIATKLGCVPRTVDRRLRLIRSIWEQEMPS